MKKFLTILLAVLTLLTGMHVTVARHFCGGEVAATRISVTGKDATCGMPTDYQSATFAENTYSSHCCEDEISVYSIENDYAPSAFQFKEITQKILHEFYIPGGISFYSSYSILTNCTNISPPDNYLASAVCMAEICVFRI